jgi:hypothetical protein
MKAYQEDRVDGFQRRAYTFFDPVAQCHARVVFTYEGKRHAGELPRITVLVEVTNGSDGMGHPHWFPAKEHEARILAMVTMWRQELETRQTELDEQERARVS